MDYRLRLGLLVLMVVPLIGRAEISSPDEARSGSLLLKMQSGYRVATRINSDIELDISGLVVRATLRQTFRNDGDEWVEGTYVFPLPESAAVDGMRFTVGERIIEGEVQEKQKAQAQYEAAKLEGKRTSLVNQQRANLFTTRLANIGPGETIEVQIEYLDTAAYEDGTFSLRIPTTLTPRYIPGNPVEDRQGSGWAADTDQVRDASFITPPQVTKSSDHRLALRASIDAGMPLEFVASRYHPIDVEETNDIYRAEFSLAGTQMDHDVELLWRPASDARPRALAFAEPNGDQQHVLIMLVPPTLAEAPSSHVPRELTFVIDTSGSMHGVSIEQARQALLLALDGLRPADRFNVVQFNSVTEALYPASVPANGERLAEARDYVRSLTANGGTEMRPAMEMALAAGKAPSHLRQIIFITDGSVGNEEALFGVIERHLADARLFTVGIGSAPNGWFMRKAAEFGRGAHVTISALHEVREKMSGLFQKLERPQVTDIVVDWRTGGDVTMYPATVPDLYYGEPVMLRARLGDAASIAASVTISGRSMVGDWQADVAIPQSAASPGVAAMWARAHIADLLQRERRGAAAEDVREEVVATALNHHLVSKYTSLVAVDKTPVRPQASRLSHEQVPNLLPHGQSQRAIFGFPATATGAAQYRQLGSLSLLLAALLLFYRVWTVRGRHRDRD